MRSIFSALRGQDGEIRLPALGTPIGTMTSWQLTRHDEDQTLYDLVATLRYINAALFNDDEYEKVIRVDLSRTKSLRIVAEEGAEVALESRRLVMKGVRLWQDG